MDTAEKNVRSMDTVNWKVEGMSCSNCALTISKYLQNKGLQNVKVNLVDGDVSFEVNGSETPTSSLAKGIESLGYKVVDINDTTPDAGKKPMNKFLRYFLI